MISKLWPPYVLAFIFSFLVYCITNEQTNYVKTLFAAKWELFMLQICGFDQEIVNINGVTVYVSVLIFSSLILYYLIDNHYKLFVSVFGVIVPIFFYAHILNMYGNLSQWFGFEDYFSVGLLRGIAGMTIGAECYIVLLPKIKIWHERKKIGMLLLCVFLSIGLVLFRKDIAFRDEVIFPYIFAVLITIAFSIEKKCTEGIITQIGCTIGDNSYNIYLWHYGICILLKKYFSGHNYWKMLAVYLLIILLVSFIAKWILSWFNAVLKRNKK